MASKPHGTAYITIYRNYNPPDAFGNMETRVTFKTNANGKGRMALKSIANQYIRGHNYKAITHWKKCRSSDQFAETHTRRLDKGGLIQLSFWHK